MSRIKEDVRYLTVTTRLIRMAGQRVRITFSSVVRKTGVVSVKDYGHCVDVLLDGHGGQPYGQVTRIERLESNGRYATVWAAEPLEASR
jgi:hypothetical protein